MVVVNDLHSSMKRIQDNVSYEAPFVAEGLGIIIISARYNGSNVIASGSIVHTTIKTTCMS